MDTEAVAHIYNGIWLSHNKEWIWVSSSDVDEPRASNTEWSELKWKSVICVQLFTTPWTVARQFPLSMGFSRQDYCSELPFLPSDDLPDPGTEPRSSALQVDSLISELPAEPDKYPATIYWGPTVCYVLCFTCRSCFLASQNPAK